jgi:cation diffusion facilitator CzcD-associated flavoprotein CzcO
MLASPVRHISLPGFPLEASHGFVSAREYLSYLNDYAGHFSINPTQGEVTGYAKDNDRFRVTFANKGMAEQYYQTVVVATGCFGQPRWPEIDGLPEPEEAVLHSSRWPGAKAFKGKRVLVIGCAISGVEIAEDCAQAGVEVMVSSRKGKVRMLSPTFLGRHFLDWWVWAERLPRWVFGPVCARGLRSPGIDLGYRDFRRRRLIAEVGGVERFENFTAVLADGREETVDAIVCATGYRHKVPFLPREVALEPGGHPAARHNESVNWPGLFFMGFPCARGVDSQYLRGMARDAPRLARRIRDRLS